MINSKINLQYTTFATPLPDFIFEGLKEYSRHANGYQPQPAELIEKLARKYNLPKETLYLTAGADEAILAFALAFGQKTYIFTPTYLVYDEAKNFHANILAINALQDKNYIVPTEKIADATLIYLANPNNPCGYTTREKVLELIKNNPQAIIVIDEVYAEFADLTVINDVQKYPNLAVLRSFSKSYGMAGNRIGFIIANPEIISKVRVKTQWANVSYLSVGAAMAALNHEEYFGKLRADVIERREAFFTFLQQQKFTALPSQINCALIRFNTEEEGIRFTKHLTDNNFIVNNGNGNSNTGLDLSFVRISIGSKEEMEKLKQVIEKYQ